MYPCHYLWLRKSINQPTIRPFMKVYQEYCLVRSCFGWWHHFSSQHHPVNQQYHQVSFHPLKSTPCLFVKSTSPICFCVKSYFSVKLSVFVGEIIIFSSLVTAPSSVAEITISPVKTWKRSLERLKAAPQQFLQGSQHSAAFRQVVAPGSREQNSWSAEENCNTEKRICFSM